MYNKMPTFMFVKNVTNLLNQNFLLILTIYFSGKTVGITP